MTPADRSEAGPRPRVSVVLPVRNGARYLEESLRSVLAQTLSSFELLAVDDGSSDATPEILASFAAADPRVRVLRNDPARRLPRALNRGFSEARGEYLTWTSDDNVYRPEALARMVAALGAGPTADIVYADYTVIDADGTALEVRRLPSIEHLGYSNIVGGCFLFRRRVLDEVGGYAEDLFLAEDYDFWLRAASRHRFEHLEEDLYLYRVHPAALGTSRRAEVLEATERALRRNLGGLPRVMRYEAFVRLRKLARDRGDRREAARAWRGALRCAPLRTLRLSARDLVSGRPDSAPA